MKKRPMIFFLLAAVLLLIAYAISSYAQWDESEEPQRLEERQMEEAEQGGASEYRGTEVKGRGDRVTKGEKKLEEFKNIPTGFMHRNYLIHKESLAGKWGEAEFHPQSEWIYVDSETYNRSLSEGTLDVELKKTIFKPYYQKMQTLCKKGVKASGVIHIRSLVKKPSWKSGQNKNPPYTQYKGLIFQCVVKGEKE